MDQSAALKFLAEKWDGYLNAPWFGDKIGLLGLGLTLLGLAYSGYQARGAKHSATLANIAAQEAVTRVAFFDRVMMLSSAIEIMKRINSFHQESLWHNSPFLCTEARGHLSQIRESDATLNDEQKKIFQRTLTNLAKIQELVVAYLSTQDARKVPPKSSNWDTLLSKDCEDLTAILAHWKYRTQTK